MPRPAKIALFTVLGLFGLLLAVGGGLIIWLQTADLRPLVISQTEKATGLQLQISGPFRVKLFPTIEVDVAGLTVPAYTGNQPLFTADSLQLRARWGALPRIWKGIAIDDLTLTNPSANLVTAKDGTVNWAPQTTAETNLPAEEKAGAKPFELPVGTLGKINIANLNAVYMNEATGQRVNAQNITLTADATRLEDTRVALTGRINNQPVTADLTTGYVNAMVPVSGSLAAANLRVEVNGQANPDEQSFAGTFSANSPNLKATLDALTTKAPEGTPADALALKGSIAVGDEALSLRQFTASLGNLLQASGDVSATWGGKTSAQGQIAATGSNLRALARIGGYTGAVPATGFSLQTTLSGEDEIRLTNTTATLNGLLTAVGDITIKPQSGALPDVKGPLTLTVPNLKALGTAFEVAQPLPQAPLTVTTKLDARSGTYTLSDLTAKLGSLLAAEGKATITPVAGSAPKLTGNLSLSGPSARALGQGLGLAQQLPAKAFNAQAAFDGQTAFSVKDAALEITDILKATGNLNVTPGKQASYKGSFTLNGGNMAEAARQFGVGAAGIPTNGFSAKSDITGEGAITLPNLQLNLPGLLEATGNVRYVPPSGQGGRQDVQATVTVGRLNLDALGFCAPAPTVSAAQSSNVSAPPAAATPWTDDPINTSALQTITFNLSADVKGITCSRAPLTAVTAKLSNTADKLTISQLDATIGSGSLRSKGALSHSGTPSLELSATGEKIAVEELVSTLKQRGLVLPLNLNTNVTSRGNTTRQLAGNLNGSLKATADSGRIPYTSMLGQATNVQNLINGGIKGLKPVSNNGDLNRLNADYTIRNGIVSTNELAVVTDGGNFKLDGTGTVDLPRWYINYTLTPVVSESSTSLSIPVLIKGPLTTPAIGADPAFIGKLTTRLATQGLQDLLGEDSAAAKGLGGAVGGILGGQGLKGALQGLQPKADATASTTTPTGNTQQENVNKLLNTLFNK